MSALAFLLATIFSICSDLSQDGRTFTSNNALYIYDAVADLKEYSAIDTTHFRVEINQIIETLSFHHTCASDERAIPSKEGKIRPIQILIDLKTFKSNRIQSIPFDDALHDAIPGSTHNAQAEAMDSTHLRGEINQINQTLSYPNACASDEYAIPSNEAINRIETRAPHTADNNVNPNALLMMTFKRKRKKTNQGMMAMQTIAKMSDICHVDQGRIKGRKERNQVFRTTASSPSTTIITPSHHHQSNMPPYVQHLLKKKRRGYNNSISTHSLCLNCNVKFPTEFKFFSNDLKTYFSDEDVNGTGFKTNARHNDGHYLQNRDTAAFITNNVICRKISSDSGTVSLSPIIEVRQKDADAFKIASSLTSYVPCYHCYQGNDVHSASLPKALTHPFSQSASNTHTKHKKHVESQRNEGITPIPALFIQSCIEIIAVSCATILFIKSSIRTTRLFIISFTERKAFLLVLLALSFRPSSALSITTFRAHTCALQTTSPTSPGFNAFKCFGRNGNGECGYERTANIGDGWNEMGASLPNIDTNCSIDDIKQVETGGYHTCILTNTGKVKCFGLNDKGQLGYGNTVKKGNVANTMGINLPFIDLGGSWSGTQIAAGEYHTCVLMSNGATHNAIKCFGLGANGALGTGDTQNRGDGAHEMGDNLTTIDLGIGFDPIQITAGDQSTCALSASNKIKCFGKNEYGKLGIGDAVNRGGSAGQMGDDLPFVALGAGFTPIRIECGRWHVCALSDLGKVKCFGLNDYGQLGLEHTRNIGDDSNEMNDSLPIVDLGSNLTVTQITVGGLHTCALFTIGDIKCWGYGNAGRLGSGNTNNVGISTGQMGDDLPFVDLGIDFAGAVTEVKAGITHTCATSSNEVKCWGDNFKGRLGYGNTASIGNEPNEMGDYLLIVDLDFPTINPSAYPTFHPSLITHDPTTTPSANPTRNPTKAPTPQDIECNDEGIATTTDGEYEYYLHIDESSIVRFDTCHTLSLFDIFIVDINDTNKAYSCTQCGSICHAPSQYQVALSVGTYRMNIDGPHAFKMICVAKPDTDAPTASPTTSQPTKTPTVRPTVNPTTLRPTEREYPVFNVSFPGDGRAPISHYTFLGDPYGRFEAYIEVEVHDAESVLGVSALCAECFVWQYRLESGVWTDIAHANNDDISVYNLQLTQTKYRSKLTIQSIRRLNGGRCIDQNANSRLFTPGNEYELRLQFVVDREYFVSSISNALSIETNALPSGGFCVIQALAKLQALDAYNLFCGGWDNEESLEYNALIKDVLINSNAFVDDARKLQSMAPVGNVSITVMIKERDVDNAVTCYPIQAAFGRISDTIHANDILDDVATIINATSFSDNPDVAVSIVTVIEDIYAENYTTQNEAAMIVDEIVSNILEGSGVLDIVLLVQNNSDDISWVVLEGDDFITELATIASITSKEDIVDMETTTTVLIDSYLPHIFEAIDVFVDVKASNDSAGVIQDQLYDIAGQLQQLIENLESTLYATFNAVDREESINETDAEQAVDDLNRMTQSLVDFATLAASKALAESDVGETFNYETDTKSIVATKFDANIIDFNDSKIADEDIILPRCGNEEQTIELPLSFMREQDGMFDCAFMASLRNSFVSKQNRTQQSDTVSINIYNIDSIPNEYESNSCFPYLITMQISDFSYGDDDMSLGDEHVFPSCDFWNVTDSLWDTSGCFVHDISGNSIVCACTHLTTFSISKDTLVPEANLLTEIDWREFTFYNLYHYPIVWLTCSSVFVVFIFICWVSPLLCDKIKTKSIMAFEDIIYKSVQEEKLWKDIAGKEIKYITDHMPNQHLLGRGLQTVAPTKEARRSVCRLQWKLYGAYLRNDHTLLSVFQRTAGTNLSLNQRLGCFFMYLCNIMLVTGGFYGLEQSTPSQDIVASFIISLCSTMPVKLIRYFFQKSKPIEVKSTKHILLDDDANVADGGHVPSNSPESPAEEGQDLLAMTTVRAPKEWMQWDMKAWMKEQDDVTIHIFNEQIQTLYDQDNQHHRIHAISDIRSVLFDKMFPLSHGFKRVGWIVLIIWSLGACITAIVYGFKFDLEATAIANTNNPHCWNKSLALQMEDRLSKKAFQLDYMDQEAKNASSYAGGDAESWLTSILQSLVTSLLLWQPLRIYVITWIKIWMFSWHLKMNVGPGNILSLCKRCCCGYHPLYEEEESNEKRHKSKLQMLSQYLSGSKQSKSAERRSSRKIREVVAHKNRPVDLLSFLGNEEWIIDDTKCENDDEINIESHDNAKQTAPVKPIGESVAHQEGEEVELQVIVANRSKDEAKGKEEPKKKEAVSQ